MCIFDRKMSKHVSSIYRSVDEREISFAGPSKIVSEIVVFKVMHSKSVEGCSIFLPFRRTSGKVTDCRRCE